jgi:hypothetical protein
MFHQGLLSWDDFLNHKYVKMLKNHVDKNQIAHLAWQVYPENISNVHLVYLKACMDQHIFDLGLKQYIKDLLKFRAKILSGEITEVFDPVRHNESAQIRHIISIFLEMLKQDVSGLYSNKLVTN